MRHVALDPTSRSFITFAGEKKCMPTTRDGSEVAAPISSTESTDVFDASVALGLQIASSFAKISQQHIPSARERAGERRRDGRGGRERPWQ